MTIRYPMLATFLLCSVSAFANQVFVEKATGSGVNESDLTTTTELISSSVTDISSDTVAEKPSQADYHLRPKLIRLGQAYVLSLAKIKDGKVIFSSQLKAAQMDELDKVATRLTRSVIHEERAGTDTRVDEVTNHEAHNGDQRRPARKEAYIGLGTSAFTNLNSTGIGYSLGLAYGWDLNRVILKIMNETAVNGSALFTSASLGGNYFLTMTDIAPYFAADFGAGFAKVDGGGAFTGQSGFGFVVGAGAGMEFYRSSSVNLDLSFRAGFLLHSNDIGLPQVFTLRLGLYF